jgi:hypothetical protein
MSINTNSSNICDNIAYQNALIIKQRFQLKNIPPQRYNNLDSNPYIPSGGSYTQHQLDMRRKAEILKYSASKSNTKTNNLTKSELWAQLVNGNGKQPSQSFIQKNIISQTANSITIQTCPSGTIIQTPTYACGVPGPITNLYLDPVIPIYNYATRQDPYALINKEQTIIPFVYDNGISQLDKQLSVINYIPQNTVTLTSIYIENTTSRYSYTITFPISMYIRADLSFNSTTLNSNNPTYSTKITLDIPNKPFSVAVNYGNNPIFGLSYEVILDISNTVTFDISMSPSISSVNNNNTNYFYGNQYVGICTINNFMVGSKYGLDSQIGYVYDIILSTINSSNNELITISNLDTNFLTYFNQPNYGLYINVSQNSVNQFINCTVESQNNYPSPNTIIPLSVI